MANRILLETGGQLLLEDGSGFRQESGASNGNKGFKMTGPACCCCPDFFVRTNGDSSITDSASDGWRALHMNGDYPDNKIRITETPVTEPTSSKGLTVDYVHKKLFICYLSVGPFLNIVEYDFQLKNRRVVMSASVPSQTQGANVLHLCCDWKNKRIFYVKVSQLDNTNPPYPRTSQLRVINYDGTGDTLVTDETWDGTPVGSFSAYQARGGIAYPVYCPNQNKLYYVFGKDVMRSTGAFSADINLYAYLKRCDDTGGGKTTLVTLEDTTNNLGDYSIFGIGVDPNAEKVAWIESWAFSKERKLKIGDMDCAGAVTLLTKPVDPSGDWEGIQNPRVNQKEGVLFYESRTTPFASGDPTQSLWRIDYDGGNNTQVLDDHQTGFDRKAPYATYRESTLNLGAAFGCPRETTGTAYTGSCYSVG